MLKKLWRWLVGTPAKPQEAAKKAGGLFSTEADVVPYRTRGEGLKMPPLLARIAPADGGEVATMDEDDSFIKPNYSASYNDIPEVQVMWYGSQGFIGYQLMAVLAQHWLIDKACTMPGQDAVRNGYDITVNDKSAVDVKVIAYIKKVDKRMKIKANLIEFARKGRTFGIRLALFVVKSDDPDYYSKRFNIDGVGPWQYKGISQIDPYWVVPELTSTNALEPGDIDFYTPEFWRVGTTLIHKSHFVIFTTGEVADVLKPSYFFGGVSIPQRIFERVYAAERTANEAPQLAMTKRTTVLSTDLTEAMADQKKFDERIAWWRQTLDNYAVKINGENDKLEQFDISLTDLGDVIMTQYQLVAAIAGVPGTKLLGTQPKGFNSTGEFEEASYHEALESLRDNDLSPLLDRHHALVVQSWVMPKFGIPSFEVEHKWNELDAMTGLEQAQLNVAKAQFAEILLGEGVIDATEERDRIIADPDSGYTGLSDLPPPMPEDPSEPPAQPGAPPAQPNLPPPPAPVTPRAKPAPGA